jgi:hypothetical protein
MKEDTKSVILSYGRCIFEGISKIYKGGKMEGKEMEKYRHTGRGEVTALF